MSELSNKEKRSVVVEQALDIISEHFDNVQIFCNTVEGGDTFRIFKGRGNVYARRGQVEEWLDGEQSQSNKEAVDRMDED